MLSPLSKHPSSSELLINVNEDLDDDDDGVSDVDEDNAASTFGHASCARGELGWISTPVIDFDQDGCQDDGEEVEPCRVDFFIRDNCIHDTSRLT